MNRILIAVEQMTTRNFLVFASDNGEVSNAPVSAFISHADSGWKVFSNNSGRKNGRTRSATPEEAARKYFKRNIEFRYLEPR